MAKKKSKKEMKKKKKVKEKETYLITGKTLDELEVQGSIADFLKRQGEEFESKLKCYLCQRRFGEESFSRTLHEDIDKVKIATPKLKFCGIKIQATDELEFIYPICHECMLMVRAITSGSYEMVQNDE